MDVMLIVIVGFALLFDFANGFHDTANAIATSVATKAVPPKVAVIGASILNFIGAFVSLHVAATIAKSIVQPEAITLSVILAGLIAAIIWNLLTWRFGLPTSSSHALIGGIMGAAIVAAGWNVMEWSGFYNKVLLPSLAAPILGFIVALLLMRIINRVIKNKIDAHDSKVFRRMQILSGSFVAFTHGTNDAQKTMGVIALALLVSQPTGQFHVPLWVIIASASAMAAGTYLGGWRIINTLGYKLVELKPPQGFAAEVSTASILGLTAHFGFPVSTTHTVSSSIIGVGAASSLTKIRWEVVKSMTLAWLITIPSVALLGGAMQQMASLPQGIFIVVTFSLLLILSVIVSRHWTRESVSQIYLRLNLIRLVRAYHQNRRQFKDEP